MTSSITRRWDVRAFQWVAPLYDRLLPQIDTVALQKGLTYVDGEIETLIDLGGGTGRAAVEFDAIVVDPAKRMGRRAFAKGVPTLYGAAESPPVQSDSADAVLIVDALHHFRDCQQALAEVNRMLRPGGVVVIQEFDRSTYRGRLLEWGEHQFGFESTFYTPQQLLGIIEQVDFRAYPIEWGFEFTLVGIQAES